MMDYSISKAEFEAVKAFRGLDIRKQAAVLSVLDYMRRGDDKYGVDFARGFDAGLSLVCDYFTAIKDMRAEDKYSGIKAARLLSRLYRERMEGADNGNTVFETIHGAECKAR